MANPKGYQNPPDDRHEKPDDQIERIEWELQRYKSAIEDGHTLMLFEAVLFCSRYNIALPHYFALELSRHLNRYKYGKAKELGEAFGITRPKHWQQERERRFWGAALPVYYWVEERRGEGMKTSESRQSRSEDGDVFDAAGKHFDISRGRAMEYYYATKNAQIPKG
jgi:hypothetical protein